MLKDKIGFIFDLISKVQKGDIGELVLEARSGYDRIKDAALEGHMGTTVKGIFESPTMKHIERASDHLGKVQPSDITSMFASLAGFPGKISNMLTNLQSETKRRKENTEQQEAIQEKIDSGLHNEETLAKLKAELEALKSVHADLTFEQATLHPDEFKKTIKEDL